MSLSSSQPQVIRVGLTRTDLLLAIGLALAAALFILPGLGLQSLANWDEAVYGVVTREFLQQPGLTLTYGGHPYFDKPAFLFWLMATSSAVFGLTEFALRLPVALTGIGCVVLTYLIGRRSGERVAGVIAAVLLLGVPQFVAYSRLAMMDVPFVTFGMLSICLFIYGNRHAGMMAGAGAAFGLALLTKSIAALVFVPGLIAFVVAYRGLRGLWCNDILIAIATAIAVALPWYAWIAMTQGRAFLSDHLLFHVANRLHPLEHHEGGPLFYFVLYWNNAGWFAPVHAIGIVLAGWLAIWRRDSEFAAFVVLALSVFIILSVQATKIGWYLTAVYPGAALATGLAIERLVHNRVIRLSVLSVLALVAIPGMLYARGSFVETYNILDYSPEIRSLKNAEPFMSRRVPTVYLARLPDPAVRFYLTPDVRPVRALERLVAQGGRLLCVAFNWEAEEVLKRYPRSGLKVIASTESLALLQRD